MSALGVIVDTSVWIHHMRFGPTALSQLLESSAALMHDDVLGELATGNLTTRSSTLFSLRNLPRCVRIPNDNALDMIEKLSLHGKGLSWIDIHLLASALASRCTLWTLDRSLHAAAVHAGVAFRAER